MMDRQGISGAVLSISTPGVLLGDMAATRRLARASNLFAAQTVADHPTRFGMFASLPLPEVKASLAEIAYALDTLRAEGVVLLTNYRDRYLGDAAFMPVFDELNHRKATVYVHPTSCGCTHGVLPDNPTAMIEFPHDTTRTVSSLLSSGTFTRCPDIKFIFSHAGGTVPFLADRMARIFAIDRRLAARTPGGILPILKRQYYDTASTANPMSFGALINMVTPANVLLGTDYPFVAEAGVKGTIDGLRQVGLDSDAIAAIEGGNAARLFARFAA
jgi:predicted TIM-barrel fold metal-dependent hydrolase